MKVVFLGRTDSALAISQWDRVRHVPRDDNGNPLGQVLSRGSAHCDDPRRPIVCISIGGILRRVVGTRCA